ncbi:MAG: GNAT family N-acetyltransferase [Pseudomonadota bacterium]
MKPALPIASGRLRPARAGDGQELLTLLRERDIRRYLCDGRMLAAGEVTEMLADSALLNTMGLGLWVLETPDCRFAGVVGLTPVSPAIAGLEGMSGYIEPTIALAPDVQRRGVAREAMTAAMAYAEHTLGLTRLVAAVDAPNERSHRLMQACGFHPFANTDGPRHPLTLYERLFSRPSETG